MRTLQILQNKGLLWLLSATLAVFGQNEAKPEGGGVRGQGEHRRYAVVLADEGAAPDPKARSAKQSQLLARLPKTVEVTDARQLLVNALFIVASEADARAIAALPGVERVEPLRKIKLLANRGLDLVNAPAAWTRVGGESQAGAGVRIGIIDSGIDHRHPAFQASGLAMPAGFPRCSAPFDNDCAAWTNNKVIVARSYVSLLNFQFGQQAADTRPDDLLPRDRVGHGTMAAMIAAGVRSRGPAAEVGGVAPAAWLGNYKVFGSPGVNDGTYANVIIAALEDAIRDGMDIVTLNLGYAAEWPPLQRTCGQNRNQLCDIQADAVHNATLRGLTVVAAAGNDGNAGFNLPALGTIASPATAPGAIAVGATTNSHVWFQSLTVTGAGGSLNPANVRFGDGPVPAAPLTAPLRDVAPLDDDRTGRACRPLPAGSLAGAIAIIKRGECPRDVKVNHAARAGALAVVLVQEDSDYLFTIQGLRNTSIPTALIGTAAGNALLAFLQQNANAPGTLDARYREAQARADEIAEFSSQGPSIGETARGNQASPLKPDLVAPGTDLYMATQSEDPNGPLYDATGYGVSQGTSFAAPFAAGAAALVKQQNRSLTPAQVKSMLVNTAGGNLIDFDYNGRETPARVRAAGGGKLNASLALQANVTADPASLSFGEIVAGPTISRGVVLRNHSNQSLNLRLEVAQRDTDRNLRVTATPATLTLGPGAQTQVTFRLEGTQVPAPGVYEGFINVTGGAIPLRIPYMYLVGDNVPFNVYAVTGDGFVRPVTPEANRRAGFLLKVIDQYGVPVRGVGATVRVLSGGGTVGFATERTDDFGIIDGEIRLGNQTGLQSFAVDVGNLTYTYQGQVKLLPTVLGNGVVNAASGQASAQGYAPGTYLSLFGSGLSDILKIASTATLPISLAGVSVSFDNTASSVSVPGRLHFVSENQINVFIPYEVSGLSTVSMKVAIGDLQSAVFTIPITNYSPAAFEYREASGQLSAAALDANFAVLSQQNPARRGQAIQLYYNGLGAVTNRPASGEPASGTNLSSTTTVPTVTIGGRPAQVLFSGLAPGLVGVYQVNVLVPSDATTGRQPVGLSIGGIAARDTFTYLQ